MMSNEFEKALDAFLEGADQNMQDAAAYIKNAPCGNTNHCRCWDWIWKMKKMN